MPEGTGIRPRDPTGKGGCAIMAFVIMSMKVASDANMLHLMLSG